MDLRWSYESSARMKKEPFATFHSFDFPGPYDAETNPIGKLKPGRYFVHFDREVLPKAFKKLGFKNGKYYHEFLNYLHRRGIPFTIT